MATHLGFFSMTIFKNTNFLTEHEADIILGIKDKKNWHLVIYALQFGNIPIAIKID